MMKRKKILPSSRKVNNGATKDPMERLFVNNAQKVELYSTEVCDSCELALHDIAPILHKHGILLEIKKDSIDEAVISGKTYPMVCIVRKVDGVEKRECFEGYYKNLAQDLESYL